MSWRFEKVFTQDQILHESKMTILETTPFLLQRWEFFTESKFPHCLLQSAALSVSVVVNGGGRYHEGWGGEAHH